MTAQDASLLVMMLIITWSVYRAHRDPNNNFNLLDLIMENGRVSRTGFGFMFALVVTSWVLILKARQPGSNVDIIFAAYGAMWVAPIITKLFSGALPPALPK
jgi:hypothetical protein